MIITSLLSLLLLLLFVLWLPDTNAIFQCARLWVGQDKRQLTRVGVKKGHSWFQKRWYKNEIIMIIFIIIILIIYVNIVVVVAVVDNFKN